MPEFVLLGAGFLVAVLWFDLMFDVQVRKHPESTLPPDVLASISAYYRRVTTDAQPMNLLVAAIMLLTVGAIVFEIARGTVAPWSAWGSFAAALSAVGLAAARVVRNAVRLGAANDIPEIHTQLARTIYRDHLFCLAAMLLVIALQICSRLHF